MVRVVRYAGAGAMLEVVQSVLEQHEAENSLILGTLLSLARAVPKVPTADLLATVHRRSDACWVLAALTMPPHPLVLAAAGRTSAKDYAALSQYLAKERTAVNELVATSAMAKEFGSTWAEVTGSTAKVRWHQRLHALSAVNMQAAVQGHLRLAALGDLELVAEWFCEFEAEALDAHNGALARERATVRVQSGQVYLWEDSEPRAMAAWARPTKNTVSVNAVYTPPLWRGRGYATAVVAELSRQLLAGGYRLCVLYTDLANATSNGIYHRIGYRPVADFSHVRFEEAAPRQP